MAMARSGLRPGRAYMAGAPLLVAHRGGALLAPENTMESFRQAVELWEADILELDVRLTADGYLVVIHDETVNRTTNGSGAVARLTWDEVRELDAGYRFKNLNGDFSFRGKGCGIPLFLELLEELPHVRLNVDAKDPAAAAPLVELIHATGAWNRVLLATEGDEGRAEPLGYRGPVGATRRQATRFYLLHRVPLLGELYTPRADALQVPFFWEGRQVTTPAFIRRAHRCNIPVHVWTIDDPGEMETLLEWQVDGIQSDRPDLLAEVLHRRAGRPPPPGLKGRMP